MPRRALLHAGLALLLLFSQAEGVVHSISHWSNSFATSSRTDKQLPHSQVCEKCLAFATIGGAMPSMPLVFGAFAVATPDSVYRAVHFHFEPHQAYASRAPPAIV
jgi:hypothetical protein